MKGRFWDALFVVSYTCLILSFILAFTSIVDYWYLAAVLYLSAPICILLVAVDIAWTIKKKEPKS